MRVANSLICVAVIALLPQLVSPSAARLPAAENSSTASAAPAAAPTEEPISEYDREHWSFQPLVRPALPAVQNAAWPRNAIDCFILARLEEELLAPSPPADRAELLRRVSFDLTGLPPTPDELAAFLNDRSDDAYERVVDRLLSSDAYGERWAQHWLDLARFAETDGFEFDHLRPNAWRYRDWVIGALNADMPFDEFVRLQLAGDEIDPARPEALVATGFLLCGPDMPDINLQEERRHVFLNDMTGTVGAAFLGLQFACAECHNHKFDPLSQADFYRLRAFFDGLDLFRDSSLALPEEERAYERLAAAHRERLVAADAEITAAENAVRARLRAELGDPNLELSSSRVQRQMTSAETANLRGLIQKRDRIKKEAPSPPMGRVARERDDAAIASRIFLRGDFRRPGPEVRPAFPRIVNPEGVDAAAAVSNGAAGGRRRALAEWITRGDHPLTWRVAANRVWQHHFGRPLAGTPSDFGAMGEEPSHPKLLDWLATELVRQGGRLKALHRLIVTSATYRQTSRRLEDDSSIAGDVASDAAWAAKLEHDPDNILLARMSRQRLDGEELRDAMLAASGVLNRRRGWPGVRPPLPAEIVATLLTDQWIVTPDQEDHDRRSIYLFVRRNLRYPLLEAFDKPDTNASCPQRNRSTIAPQSLMLLNSELSVSLARAFAGRLLRDGGTEPDAWIERGYLAALSRRPNADEARLGREFVQTEAARMRAAGLPAGDLLLPEPLSGEVDSYRAAALTAWCLGMFNLNEFAYVD